MEKQMNLRVQHIFNYDAEEPGPMLIIEAVSPESGFDDMIVAHKWYGSGVAKKQETKKLIKHLAEQPALEMISGYIERAVL